LTSVTVYGADEVQLAVDNFLGYLSELVNRRRDHPADDLLSAMIHARDVDDRLSESELIRLVGNMLIAGHDTTSTQIANNTYLLLHNRQMYEKLVADATLIPSAVEELLRFIPLIAEAQSAGIAMEDLEINGTLIRAGEAVMVSTAAANRDGDATPDPDDFDIARGVNPHLSFGHGIHYCIGAHLARLELRTVLSVLTERLPRLRFGVPEQELTWSRGRFLRQLEALPVAW
jgi:cytochrome P450 monooxygenase OleP